MFTGRLYGLPGMGGIDPMNGVIGYSSRKVTDPDVIKSAQKMAGVLTQYLRAATPLVDSAEFVQVNHVFVPSDMLEASYKLSFSAPLQMGRIYDQIDEENVRIGRKCVPELLKAAIEVIKSCLERDFSISQVKEFVRGNYNDPNNEKSSFVVELKVDIKGLSIPSRGAVLNAKVAKGVSEIKKAACKNEDLVEARKEFLAGAKEGDLGFTHRMTAEQAPGGRGRR